MEFFCVVVLFLSSVAARPDPWSQWLQEMPQLPTFSEVKSNGDPRPTDGGGAPPQIGRNPMGGGSGGRGPMSGGPVGPRGNGGRPGRPQWQGEMPPWMPNTPMGGPGNGGSQQPIRGARGPNPPGGTIGPDFSNIPAPGAFLGQMPLDFGGRRGGPIGSSGRGGPSGRPNGRPKGRPNKRPTPLPGAGDGSPFDGILLGGKPHPGVEANREFITLFKADNVTFNNSTGLLLKEGENIFLLPQDESGPPPPKGGIGGPQRLGYGYGYSGLQPYIKLIYNPSATQKISFEYGITQLLPIG